MINFSLSQVFEELIPGLEPGTLDPDTSALTARSSHLARAGADPEIKYQLGRKCHKITVIFPTAATATVTQ